MKASSLGCGHVIETTTHILQNDEPCFGLSVREDDDGHFRSRLLVLRGDDLQMAVVDHGEDPEYAGKIPPMYIPSDEGENPVGLMLEMSERHRHDLRWYRRAIEMREGSTLIRDVLRQEEQLLLAAKNVTVIGPHQTTQRNGHDSTAVRREWWAERARRTGKKTFYPEMRIRA